MGKEIEINTGKPHNMSKYKEPNKIEPAEKLDAYNVMHWEPETKRLMRLKANGTPGVATILTKATKIIEQNCLEQTGDSPQGHERWQCKPLKGNSLHYTILYRGDNGSYDCDCQGFTTKIKQGDVGNCSHIVALKQLKFIKEKNA